MYSLNSSAGRTEIFTFRYVDVVRSDFLTSEEIDLALISGFRPRYRLFSRLFEDAGNDFH